MTELYQLKQAIYDYCFMVISNRIQTIESVLQSLEESKNNESKSSVGDKYETGRAMLHLEEEKNKTQLTEAMHAKAVLESIHLAKVNKKIQIGSLVITNTGKYFIGIGIGKIMIGKELIYGISPDSPIGQILQNKKVDDLLYFNNRPIVIETII